MHNNQTSEVFTTYPSGGTKHIAANSRTASNIVVGSDGSTVRDKMVSASSWFIMAIKPNCGERC